MTTVMMIDEWWWYSDSATKHRWREHSTKRVSAAEQTGDTGVQIRCSPSANTHLAQGWLTSAGKHTTDTRLTHESYMSWTTLDLLLTMWLYPSSHTFHCTAKKNCVCVCVFRCLHACAFSLEVVTCRSTMPTCLMLLSTPVWPVTWQERPGATSTLLSMVCVFIRDSQPWVNITGIVYVANRLPVFVHS